VAAQSSELESELNVLRLQAQKQTAGTGELKTVCKAIADVFLDAEKENAATQ